MWGTQSGPNHFSPRKTLSHSRKKKIKNIALSWCSRKKNTGLIVFFPDFHCLYIDITLFTNAQSRDLFFAEEQNTLLLPLCKTLSWLPNFANNPNFVKTRLSGCDMKSFVFKWIPLFKYHSVHSGSSKLLVCSWVHWILFSLKQDKFFKSFFSHHYLDEREGSENQQLPHNKHVPVKLWMQERGRLTLEKYRSHTRW